MATEQHPLIYETVQKCFTEYELQVIKRINDDIQSRQMELENLLQQKQSREINREQELKRLQILDEQVGEQVRQIESVYNSFLESES